MATLRSLWLSFSYATRKLPGAVIRTDRDDDDDDDFDDDDDDNGFDDDDDDDD